MMRRSLFSRDYLHCCCYWLICQRNNRLTPSSKLCSVTLCNLLLKKKKNVWPQACWACCLSVVFILFKHVVLSCWFHVSHGSFLSTSTYGEYEVKSVTVRSTHSFIIMHTELIGAPAWIKTSPFKDKTLTFIIIRIQSTHVEDTNMVLLW